MNLPQIYQPYVPKAREQAGDLAEAAAGALRIVEFAMSAVVALAVGAAVLGASQVGRGDPD